MDRREASLNLLKLALTDEKQIDMTSEKRVSLNLNSLRNLQERMARVEGEKKHCPQGDSECRAKCKRRREMVIKLLMTTFPQETLSNSTLSEKIDKLLEEYDETYKQALSASDFFDSSDEDMEDMLFS